MKYFDYGRSFMMASLRRAAASQSAPEDFDGRSRRHFSLRNDTWKIRLLILVALLMSSFLFPLPASAQTSRGTVSGVVSDSTGAVIPGAAVTLTGAETGINRTTVT